MSLLMTLKLYGNSKSCSSTGINWTERF